MYLIYLTDSTGHYIYSLYLSFPDRFHVFHVTLINDKS